MSNSKNSMKNFDISFIKRDFSPYAFPSKESETAFIPNIQENKSSIFRYTLNILKVFLFFGFLVPLIFSSAPAILDFIFGFFNYFGRRNSTFYRLLAEDPFLKEWSE